MANFKKTIATAKAKVAEADVKAFQARFEAIEAVLEGASPQDIMVGPSISARTAGGSRCQAAAEHSPSGPRQGG